MKQNTRAYFLQQNHPLQQLVNWCGNHYESYDIIQVLQSKWTLQIVTSTYTIAAQQLFMHVIE